MSIVGRTYLERGEPVTVLAQWRQRQKNDEPRPVSKTEAVGIIERHSYSGWAPYRFEKRSGPHNVLIRREASGELVVRPFRGLRRPATEGRRPVRVSSFKHR